METLKSEEQLEYEALRADNPDIPEWRDTDQGFEIVVTVHDQGFEIVVTVHDEVICEAPDHPAFSHHILSALMARGEDWTEGLPLAAAGFEAYRYRKG